MATGGSQHTVNGQTHYERNKPYYREKKILRTIWIRAILRRLKDKPCMDCGVKYPYYVMEFDHRDPGTKLIGPSKMQCYGWCEKRIKEELDKCDVVCSNCHKQRTYDRARIERG